jgi:ribosome-interacting GTPase 1|tara:strand:+ start:631 stop:870 length:240 start_codon:yes stop_codon:yes gene_type:complete
MNKIIFVTQPDLIEGDTYAIKNYNNGHIKELLTQCNITTAFYLIEEDCTSEWLNSVIKQSKIIFDCSKSSIQNIVNNVR